jgi:hypothetical protein
MFYVHVQQHIYSRDFIYFQWRQVCSFMNPLHCACSVLLFVYLLCMSQCLLPYLWSVAVCVCSSVGCPRRSRSSIVHFMFFYCWLMIQTAAASVAYCIFLDLLALPLSVSRPVSHQMWRWENGVGEWNTKFDAMHDYFMFVFWPWHCFACCWLDKCHWRCKSK